MDLLVEVFEGDWEVLEFVIFDYEDIFGEIDESKEIKKNVLDLE